MAPEINFETEVVDVYYSSFLNKRRKSGPLPKNVQNALDLIRARFLRLRYINSFTRFILLSSNLDQDEEATSESKDPNPLFNEMRSDSKVRTFSYKVFSSDYTLSFRIVSSSVSTMMSKTLGII